MKNLSVLLILLLGLIISCSLNDLSGTTDKEETADLEFSISLAKAQVPIISMTGFLSKSGEDTIWFDFVIENDNASCKVKNIKPGEWQLTVNAYNAQNMLAYTGSTKVKITPGEETTVYLHLDPATGSLRVIVTWGDDLSNGLIAYYPFNGNADDESGNGNDGMVYGPVPCEDRFGNSDQAYCFDGYNDFIVLNSDFSLKKVSVALWIKPDTIPQEGSIFFKSNDYLNDWGLFLRDSLHLLDDIYDDNEQLYKTEISTDWHFVVAILGHKKQNLLYVDGKLVGSGDYAGGTWKDINGKIYIGQRGTSRFNGYFNGKIDDIRIYKRVLSENEIQLLYNENE